MDFVRISTGIAGLDRLLKGGFIKGRSYLLTGETGTGKTIACLQFLVSSLALGERAVYVTVDERPAEILASAASFSWDIQSHIQGKSLVILDASASATEKGIDAQKIVADLGGYAKSLRATILIIDPITPLLLAANPAIPHHLHARSLIQLIHAQLNTTNLFTSHEPRAEMQDAGGGVEQFLASGVLVLKTSEIVGRRERLIHIKKMRQTAVEPGEYPFVLVKNEGIVLVERPSGVPFSPQVESPFFKSFEPSN
jgi:circadian clock protein KaiC